MSAIETEINDKENQLKRTESNLKDTVSCNHRKLASFQHQIEDQIDIVTKNEKELAELEVRKAALVAENLSARKLMDESRRQRIQLEEEVTRQRAPLLALKGQLITKMESLKQQLLEKNVQVLSLVNTGMKIPHLETSRLITLQAYSHWYWQ